MKNKLFFKIILKAFGFCFKIIEKLKTINYDMSSYENVITNKYFEEASSQLGIKSTSIGDIFEYEYNNIRRRRINLWIDIDSYPTGYLAADKTLCLKLLRDYGLPVPRAIEIKKFDFNKAIKTAGCFQKTIVIKPAKGTSDGCGVTANIHKNDKFKIMKAFLLAAIHSESVLFEEFIEGENYRLLICNGQLLSAVHRIPAFVTGDGKSSLKSLINKENKRRLENLNKIYEGVYEHPLTLPIKVDGCCLCEQKILYSDVIDNNRRVFCRNETNYNTGGAYFEVTESVHQEIIDLGINAANAIGINLAGIDIICKDITKPLKESGVMINEVNTTPGPAAHYEVLNQGELRNVAVPILKTMFNIY